MQRGPSAPRAYSPSHMLGQQFQQRLQSPHGPHGSNRPDITTDDARDQEQQQELVQLSLELPITYMPFKFENRRVRIDWRLLHGVDIDKLIRDTDLDTLEELVTCVTWGDLEAEDTRHLSEASFVKVFRLAQLLLEYLLYVQENLKYTNSVLDRSRSAAVLHAQGLSSRCRELYTQLKHCKKELKRANKTVKTFELMAAAVGGAAAAQAQQAAAAQAAAAQQAASTAAAAAAGTPVVKQEAAAAGVQTALSEQQQQGSVMTAGEQLLQSQLTELTERLTLAVCEAERLRTERQELQYQIRHLHDTLATKLGNRASSSSSNGGGGSSSSRSARDATAAQEEAAAAAAAAAAAQQQQQLFMAELQCARSQISELEAESKGLREQLQQQASDAATSAAESTLAAALQAQLEEQGRELVRLQGELRERESSIKVFQSNNAALQQQLEALQRQLASPEATTPSFVAKQRKQLAAAATAQAGLQAENMQLRQELLELRLAMEAGEGCSRDNGAAAGQAAAGGAAAAKGGEEEEEDTLAAAERLLGGGSSSSKQRGTAAAAVSKSSSDWKVEEIERLQDDNKQLQAKAASLQSALHDLESSNARLEKRLAAARAAGFAVDALSSPPLPSSPAQSASPKTKLLTTAGAAAAEGGLLLAGGGGGGGSGWASVSSSGPTAELTAADLAAAGHTAVGSAAAPAATSVTAVETCGDGIDSKDSAAAAAMVKQGGGVGGSDGGVGDGGRIAAYRPSRGDTAGGAAPDSDNAHPAAAHQSQQQQQVSTGGWSSDASSSIARVSSDGGGAAAAAARAPAGAGAGAVRGSIDQAAAAQLRSLVAALQAELSPEQLSEEYAEVCCDWDKPFDLTDEEKQQFRQKVPLEVEGLRDVLCAQPHTAEEVTAAKASMLPAINRMLDVQVASFGIHPGRTGLSNVELLAAMKMLSERREAVEAQLTPEQRQDVEVARLGLLLHPYHALQATMATLPDGPDGKKHLPQVPPALMSAVRPPGGGGGSGGGGAASLPAPPPPIRLQPRGHTPLGSPGGFGGGGGVEQHQAPAGAAMSVSPPGSANARYAVAGSPHVGSEGVDSPHSEGRGHFPTKQQQQQGVGGGFGFRGASSSSNASAGGAGGSLRPLSPLGSEATREAMVAARNAAGSGSFSPMSAALHAKQQQQQHMLQEQHGFDGGSTGGAAYAVSPAGSTASGRSPTEGAGSGGGVVQQSGQGSPTKQQQQQQQQQRGEGAATLVQVSPSGVSAVPLGGGGGSMVQQQQQAASVATKQFALTSFDDSDEF